MLDLLWCTGNHDSLSGGGPFSLARRCEPARLFEGGPLYVEDYLRTTTRPEPVVPVPVVIVVVVVIAVMTLAPNGMRPVRTGAKCMRASAEMGDMDSTIRAMLRRGQQIHLQLFRATNAIRQRLAALRQVVARAK
ncbi:hypothetical protein PY254_03745 [Rhodanobacter sp. AS-Z3]|uniref:hypothetical protein n=1 Tax=Rhodanobacter sp. AS-Z3 TaxID=3031330 RepID=UPI00247A0EEB|nr:hypothetical protein [Rhodanobacter sp. AS-Z3]WEN15797.1 hypothetical protein PY254_03745 [Rhodanobacter sp. AS-Z3]